MGCPWDAKTCEHAVKNRNLKMLNDAHENAVSKEAYAYCFDHSRGLNGYYFDKIPTNPESSHIEIFEYLKKNDCPVLNDDEWKLSRNGIAPSSSSWPAVSLDDIWYGYLVVVAVSSLEKNMIQMRKINIEKNLFRSKVPIRSLDLSRTLVSWVP